MNPLQTEHLFESILYLLSKGDVDSVLYLCSVNKNIMQICKKNNTWWKKIIKVQYDIDDKPIALYNKSWFDIYKIINNPENLKIPKNIWKEFIEGEIEYLSQYYALDNEFLNERIRIYENNPDEYYSIPADSVIVTNNYYIFIKELISEDKWKNIKGSIGDWEYW